MAPDNPTGRLRALQAEILKIARRLGPVPARLRELKAGIDLGDDTGMIEGTEPPSLAFELYGAIELAVEALDQAAGLLHRAAVESDESLRQTFRRTAQQDAATAGGEETAELAQRAGGDGSPERGRR